VNRARNRAIHDAWVSRPGEMTATLRGGRRARDVTVTAQMLAEARQLAGQETGRDIGGEPR
jgi:hypothetical protein